VLAALKNKPLVGGIDRLTPIGADRFPTTANNGKLRQSLSFFGKEWRKIAGLTEIAIE
jgi:hypothetical protein